MMDFAGLTVDEIIKYLFKEQDHIRETLEILICSSEGFRASLSAQQENAFRSQMNEATSFLSLQESLKPSDLGILYLKMFPVCLVRKRDTVSQRSLTRFPNWGIAYAGVALTAKISESDNPESECSLSDILESEVPSKYWLSERSTRKISGCL